MRVSGLFQRIGLLNLSNLVEDTIANLKFICNHFLSEVISKSAGGGIIRPCSPRLVNV